MEYENVSHWISPPHRMVGCTYPTLKLHFFEVPLSKQRYGRLFIPQSQNTFFFFFFFFFFLFFVYGPSLALGNISYLRSATACSPMLGLNLNSHQCRFRPSTTLLVANQIPLPTRNDLNSLESVSHFWFLPVIHCRHASILFLGSQANKTGQGQARQTQHDSFLLLQIRSYSKRTPRLTPDSPPISNIHYRHWAALHTRCARGHPL